MKNQNDINNEQNRSGAPNSDSALLILPVMKTVEDAQQLRQLEQYPFYLSAFMIQMWAGHALMAVTAEYAEKKSPRTRVLQSGRSWQSFTETLGHHFEGRDDRACQAEVPPSSSSIINNENGRRDIRTNCFVVRSANRAIVPTIKSEADLRLDPMNVSLFISDIFRLIRYEHPIANTMRKALDLYLNELGDSPEELRKVVTQPIIEFQRLCDWLDSVLHMQTHMAWHLAPVAFDP